MGLTIQATEFIIDKLIILITYFTVIPIIGCFRAWVAEKMGDDTPERMGFLTLNPLVHISYFWLLLMIIDIVPFGFGRYIPLDPERFYSPFRALVAYLSDAFANILMALAALFCFVLFFGSDPLSFFLNFSHAHAAAMYPGYENTSSFAVVIALFLRNIVFFNSMLAAFNIIVNLFYAAFFYFYSRKQGRSFALGGDHMQWVMIVGPVIFLILFVNVIRVSILYAIITIGMWFWQLISLLL